MLGRWLEYQLLGTGHVPLFTLGGSWHLTCQPKWGWDKEEPLTPCPLYPWGHEEVQPNTAPPSSQPFFTAECKFREILLPNNYNAYECHRYPGMFIALSKNGKTKKGNRVSPTMKVTHFLPRL